MHIVALDGSGIKTINDLKGKRVSTGAPGSGTEVKGLRVLEAYGISPKDLKSQERLGASESAARYEGPEDRRFHLGWRLAHGGDSRFRRPRRELKSNSFRHGDGVAKMVAKYGPVYFVAHNSQRHLRGNGDRCAGRSVDESARRCTSAWTNRWPIKSPSCFMSARRTW